MKRSQTARLFLVLAMVMLALVMAACSDPEPDEDARLMTCADGGQVWQEYRLFMGRDVEGSEVVSDADWEGFMDGVVTPRFPGGLSVIDVAGQGSADGVTHKERSKLLLILAPPDTGALERMNEIITEYKSRFGANTVLRVVTDACVAFK